MVFIGMFASSELGTNMLRKHRPEEYERLRLELLKMRKKANLSQVQLADKLKVRQQFVSKYETGERNLDFVEVCLVCKACGVDVGSLKIGL
ncbi:MAG: helix-turn-helix transcriptional regulator [Emcibacteraceae bacterium]|nr:helix-turn-helix transcriptional regulator [Emcibacteraceae bacterium]